MSEDLRKQMQSMARYIRSHPDRANVGDSIKYALKNADVKKMCADIKKGLRSGDYKCERGIKPRISPSLIYKLRSNTPARTSEATIDVLAQYFRTEWEVYTKEVAWTDETDGKQYTEHQKTFEFPLFYDIELGVAMRDSSPKLKDMSPSDIMALGIQNVLKIVNEDAVQEALQKNRQVAEYRSNVEEENYTAEKIGGTIPVITEAQMVDIEHHGFDSLLSESTVKVIPRGIKSGRSNGYKSEWFGVYLDGVESIYGDNRKLEYKNLLPEKSILVLNKNPDTIQIGDRILVNTDKGCYIGILEGTDVVGKGGEGCFSALDRVKEKTGLKPFYFIADKDIIDERLKEQADNLFKEDYKPSTDPLLQSWYKIVGQVSKPFGEIVAVPFPF